MTLKLQWLGLTAVLAAYFALKILGSGDTIDFKYIWLAGELWSDSTNPYTQAYIARGETLFEGLNRPTFWVYPPNWWPIATGVALLPYETAGLIWRVFSAACLLLGCFLVSNALKADGISPWYHIAFWGLAATTSAAAVTLSLGQTSMMMFLGICLFVSALLRQDRLLMVAALVLLALKPTLGLVMAAALLPVRLWWPAILGAGGVTLALTIPALVQHGPSDVFGNMLARLGEYGQVDVNMPPEMTGLRHLADRFGGLQLGTFTCLGLGMLVNFLAGFLLDLRSGKPTALATIALVLAVSAFFVPLHTYDLIFVTLLVLLTVGMPIALHAVCLLSIFLVWRANSFEALLSVTDPATHYFKGSLLSSIALLSLFLAIVIAIMMKAKD